MRFQQTYNIGKSTLNVKFGDLGTARTEVIVTSDDQQLSMGGGTSKAIRNAAGESVYEASRGLIPVPLGGVVPTTAGNLAAEGVRHIFHAATIPSASERSVKNPESIVREATTQAIKMLEAHQLKSIAFPALGTGFAGFDARDSGIAMAEVIHNLLTVSQKELHVEIWIWMDKKREMQALTFLSEITERAHLAPNAVRSHAVVLIHGIRTAAGWRERIGNEIEDADPYLTPIPVGYEFFDVLRFLIPITPWRRKAAETVWMKMKSLYTNPNIEHVSVIAHSFGTWIVGYLLTEKADARFHRIIFCGAVLDSQFDWEKVKDKTDQPNFRTAPNARVVNDCGTRDIWPIFAKFATWGYGVSGRWGFQSALVKDRFHKINHGGFFEEGFAGKNWVPALIGTTLTRGIDRGIEPPWWIMVLTILKLPYLIIASVLIAGVLIWYFC
jgi:O-acetyl-ADP-ribose deacetylase (regulator of RNase III)/pimeloyl-ACP methyl ester carboxylesterase